MYIQITTRCNMTCEHCCHSCTEDGIDMSMKTFKQVLDQSNDSEDVTIGGGEPTLHPKFNEILLMAITKYEDVFIVTNGKIKDKALMLAKLARKGAIGAEISTDYYHDYLEDEIYDAFKSNKHDENDRRGHRDVTRNIVNIGRAAETGAGEVAGCLCPHISITPLGFIKMCGCPDAPEMGHVAANNIRDLLYSWEDKYGYDHGDCYLTHKEKIDAKRMQAGKRT